MESCFILCDNIFIKLHSPCWRDIIGSHSNFFTFRFYVNEKTQSYWDKKQKYGTGHWFDNVIKFPKLVQMGCYWSTLKFVFWNTNHTILIITHNQHYKRFDFFRNFVQDQPLQYKEAVGAQSSRLTRTHTNTTHTAQDSQNLTKIIARLKYKCFVNKIF